MEFFNSLLSFKNRFMTSVILIALIGFVLLYDNYFLFWLVLGVFYIISFYEANRLFKIDNNFLYVFAILLWIISYFLKDKTDIIFIIAIIFLSLKAYKSDLDLKLIYPFLYPCIGFLFLLNLYSDFGNLVVVWLLFIVAGTDIGAFFIGKKFGKRPFSPSSPSKTLEGLAGGVFLGTLLGVFSFISFNIYFTILVSFLVSLSSIFGDLFESYLKRQVLLKDSGSILPGHGGVLDRVDGYLFAAIIMKVCLGFSW